MAMKIGLTEARIQVRDDDENEYSITLLTTNHVIVTNLV